MRGVKKSNKGFTLVELLVVISIIAILAAVIVPNVFRAIEKSKISKALSDVQAFKTAALQFYSDVGFFPADTLKQGEDTGIGAQNIDEIKRADYTLESIKPFGFQDKESYLKVVEEKWQGPYLDGSLQNKKTPWGGEYDYEVWYEATHKKGKGIFISVHGIPEESAKKFVEMSSFEVVKNSCDSDADGIQDEWYSGYPSDTKAVILKIADWPY